MPPSPDFRARTIALLDTAAPDATIVVASAGPDGGLLMQTSDATPRTLVAIARSLLSQATDMLESVDLSEDGEYLWTQVKSALAELPEAED
jgi:hypothetical protein